MKNYWRIFATVQTWHHNPDPGLLCPWWKSIWLILCFWSVRPRSRQETTIIKCTRCKSVGCTQIRNPRFAAISKLWGSPTNLGPNIYRNNAIKWILLHHFIHFCHFEFAHYHNFPSHNLLLSKLLCHNAVTWCNVDAENVQYFLGTQDTYPFSYIESKK